MNYQELRDEIKTAMKAKDKVRLAILRQVLGEIKNIEVNERREITDADVDAMLKRTIKRPISFLVVAPVSARTSPIKAESSSPLTCFGRYSSRIFTCSASVSVRS